MGGSPDRGDYLKEVEKGLASVRKELARLIDAKEREGVYSAATLKETYLECRKGYQLTVYAAHLAEELRKCGQERTARAYLTSIRRLTGFLRQPDLTFGQLNEQLLEHFQNGLRAQGKSMNTISFYLRNIRSVYNKAVKASVISPGETNIFRRVYTGVDDTVKRSLTPEELKRLSCMKVANAGLQKALNLFLFSFFARGMPFVDMAYLRKENLNDGVIAYYRKKTGQFMEVKINPQLAKILEAFENRQKGSPFLLPIIDYSGGASCQLRYESALRLQNKRLKLLAQMEGINKTLSTHVARHTWASLAKIADLPLAVISEGLGHTSIKTTYIYLASFNRAVLDSANEKVVSLIR